MEKLSIQEEETMQAIWRLEKGFIRDIIEEMNQGTPYTTVASTIKNLEKKGFVSSEKLANAKRYFPKISQEEYKRQFMKGFISNYFDNSYKNVVSFFAEDKDLKPEELEEILKMIK